MGKKTPLKHKLLLLLCFCLFVLVFWYFHLPCVFLKYLHIPCPGCGMSRAIFAAVRLDFAEAFSNHAMFWSMPVLLIYFFTDGKLLPGKWADKILLWLIGAGFVVQWMVKLWQILV